MSAYAAYAALALVLLLWIVLAVAVVMVARFWRKVEPTVTPMLSMFAPPAAGTPAPFMPEHEPEP